MVAAERSRRPPGWRWGWLSSPRAGRPPWPRRLKRRPARQGFAVEPFRNVQGIGALQHLTYGLPARHRRAVRAGRAAALRGSPRALQPQRRPPAPAGWCADRSNGAPTGTSPSPSRSTPPPRPTRWRRGPRGRRQGRRAGATAVQAADRGVRGAARRRLRRRRPGARARADFARCLRVRPLWPRRWAPFTAAAAARPAPSWPSGYLRHALLVEPTVPEMRRFLGARAAGDREAATRARHADLRARQASGLPAGAAQPGRDRSRRGRRPAARDRYARLVELDPDDIARPPRLRRAAAASRPPARGATRAGGGAGGHARRRAGAPAAGDGAVVAAPGTGAGVRAGSGREGRAQRPGPAHGSGRRVHGARPQGGGRRRRTTRSCGASRATRAP